MDNSQYLNYVAMSGTTDVSNPINMSDIAEPSQGPTGTGKLYKKDGNAKLFWKSGDTGTEVDLTGAGTSGVLGPAGAIADDIATFDGITGLLIKDSGVSIVPVTTTNVKINTAAGATRLDFGNLTLIDSTGSNNLMLGNAVSAGITTSSDNILISESQGSFTSGNNNVIVTPSISAVTSGTSNVIVGRSAGLLLDTSNGSTLIGNGSGATITSGASNVCIGASADVNSATAINRIALGTNSNCLIDNTALIGSSGLTSVACHTAAVCGLDNFTTIGAKTIADLVTGPTSVTDNAICTFDATTGKLIQDSGMELTKLGTAVILGPATVTELSPIVASAIELGTTGNAWDGLALNPIATISLPVAAAGNNGVIKYDSTLTLPTISDGVSWKPLLDLGGTATLTNKTMTGATNTLTASVLKSATTEINVSSATAPTVGQVLTATSGTAATWQAAGGGGGGFGEYAHQTDNTSTLTTLGGTAATSYHMTYGYTPTFGSLNGFTVAGTTQPIFTYTGSGGVFELNFTAAAYINVAVGVYESLLTFQWNIANGVTPTPDATATKYRYHAQTEPAHGSIAGFPIGVSVRNIVTLANDDRIILSYLQSYATSVYAFTGSALTIKQIA